MNSDENKKEIVRTIIKLEENGNKVLCWLYMKGHSFIEHQWGCLYSDKKFLGAFEKEDVEKFVRFFHSGNHSMIEYCVGGESDN